MQTLSSLLRGSIVAFALIGAAIAAIAQDKDIILNDDGGWCWFEDARALIQGNELVVGTVANGSHNSQRRGNIEVSSYDFATGEIVKNVLHKNLQADDHDSPAFLARPDGRWLSMYCGHHMGNRIYYRISIHSNDIAGWQSERVFAPSPKSYVTYSNPQWVGRENAGKGRIYNFFRGYENTFKPGWMFSDDFGRTWSMGGLLIDFPHSRRQRPYVKYVSDGKETIHFAFTEGHPAEYDTSIYHAYYRKGRVYRTDGKEICSMGQTPILPREATQIFAGDSNNVAWIHGIALNKKGEPRVVYSVQKNSAGLPSGQGGMDLRYRFAKWDGTKWQDSEIAYAGSRLYPGQDDYAGGICLHPEDPETIYISTNVDPVTGRSPAHYEIYSGSTKDGGKTWSWAPITRNSTNDNLRPIVPSWPGAKGKTALLWLRGSYENYTKYSQEVVLRILTNQQ